MKKIWKCEKKAKKSTKQVWLMFEVYCTEKSRKAESGEARQPHAKFQKLIILLITVYCVYFYWWIAVTLPHRFAFPCLLAGASPHYTTLRRRVINQFTSLFSSPHSRSEFPTCLFSTLALIVWTLVYNSFRIAFSINRFEGARQLEKEAPCLPLESLVGFQVASPLSPSLHVFFLLDGTFRTVGHAITIFAERNNG